MESKIRKDKDHNERDKYPKGIRNKSVPRQEGSRANKRVWKKETLTEDEKHPQSDFAKQVSYPRKEEPGEMMENTIKWSHQHLSSKIKEMQILKDESGHIKDLHVRY